MPHYRRAKSPGASYFFTVVTHHRRPILTKPDSRRALRQAINDVRIIHPFTIDAWVLLPEHLHCIWTLPNGDCDFSKRWGMIKSRFSKQVGPLIQHEAPLSESRRKHREASIWQRRFWEHQIRDEHDYNTYIDYIHYNPVKHGLVSQVTDWPYSTFHKYVNEGLYPDDWGAGVIAAEGDFGE
ncbi:MAG: transposase [Gammaproteobacteria bacterium]|jgi:putative transposase